MSRHIAAADVMAAFWARARRAEHAVAEWLDRADAALDDESEDA